MTLEAYKNMRIEYTRLFDKIKSEGMTQKIFMENANIKAGTLNKLLHGQSVTTEIICRICDYFQCMPDEIMEWIPDNDYIERKQAKINIEQQIAELQEQLKQI